MLLLVPQVVVYGPPASGQNAVVSIRVCVRMFMSLYALLRVTL